MNISIHELKKALFVLQILIGIFLIGVSIYLFQSADLEAEPISQLLTGIILLVVGICSTFFGVETYLLRDDPEIWR